MPGVVFVGLKGNIKDVTAKLKTMSNDEYNGLKASALSAAAKKQRGYR